MNSSGKLIKEKRTRQKMSLRLLADLADMSPTTLWRIEQGGRQLRDHEAEVLAEALGMEPESLLSAGSEEDSKTPLFPGGFFDFLNTADEFIEASEDLRVTGQPLLAIIQMERLTARLQQMLERTSHSDRPSLQRLLGKALTTRAVAFTMIAEPAMLRSQYGFDPQIDEIRKYSRYFHEDEPVYLDMAEMLPAMFAYLRDEFPFADAWFEKYLPNLRTPYVRGLALRDQIVIAGNMGTQEKYRGIVTRAKDMAEQGLLSVVDRARVFEGITRAAVRLALPNTQTSAAEAAQIYSEAEETGEGRISIGVQIVRTRVMTLVHTRGLDEEIILHTIQSGIGQIRSGGFGRHLHQIQDLLASTNSPKLHEFSASLAI
jgi:transcriptional regulator with XRE-family HTH domain